MIQGFINMKNNIGFINVKQFSDTIQEHIDDIEITGAKSQGMLKAFNIVKSILHDSNQCKIENLIEVPASGIGDLSDGDHTFNELYYQRMILFATIVKQNRDIAWKSYKHEDGELCFGGGWFIVGIDTPEGPYTYHYNDKYFDLFECIELPVAKHYDGHTDKDVTRLQLESHYLHQPCS